MLTEKKIPLTIQLSGFGLKRLDRLKGKLGYRRAGTLQTAVRVCSMAHGCGQNEPLYIQSADGEFERLLSRDCAVTPVPFGETHLVTVLCTLRGKSALNQCGSSAGGQQYGLERALAFLERVMSDGFPELFERRGSQFYPVIHPRRR